MKILLFTIVTVFISISSYGNEQVPGIIIFEHSTIKVVFDVPTITFTSEWNFSRLHLKAYYHDASGKKSRVKGKDALEIQLFIGTTDTIRMVSTKMYGISKRVFAILEKSGKVNMFKMYATSNPNTSSSHGSYFHEYYAVKRGNNPKVKAQRLIFKKGLLEFFNDCPAALNEIDVKRHTSNEMPFIVDFYNKNCDVQKEIVN